MRNICDMLCVRYINSYVKINNHIENSSFHNISISGFQPDDDMTQAISYFGSSVLSVEIAKDSVVHKIYFHKSEKVNVNVSSTI